jgi:D-3-phosphoglycerate dehydrogenase|tara:strand:+ start:648 stop:1586 length:939 start_codon:yes stop_codon:yes gene_type:complete
MLICFDSIFFDYSNKLKSLVQLSGLDQLRPEHFEFCQGVIVRLGITLKKNTLAKFKQLKFIGTITTGLDHIDQDFCKDNNIDLISLKGETDFLLSIKATPEHTWALLLSLIRKLPQANDSVRNNVWNRNLFFGEELNRKTLGIIGFGRVGKLIARYAHAFDMNVIAYDHTDFDEEEYQVRKVNLDTLLEDSHIVSVDLPLDNDTIRFVSKGLFNKMKKRPWIVNTSRGSIVDEDALLEALKEKKIKGAAVDVLANEVDFKNKKATNQLIEYAKNNDNLLITPHIAGSTWESMTRTALFIESKILKRYPHYSY